MKKLVKLFFTGKTILYILHIDGEAQAPVEFSDLEGKGIDLIKEQLEKDQVDTVKTDAFTEELTASFKEAGIEIETPEKKEVTKSDVIEEYEFIPPTSASKTETSKEMKDLVGQTVIRSFAAEVKDLGNGVMEAVISSEALDRHGEKIDMKGMDINKYMKNPIMAAFHDYSKPSVGRTIKLSKKADGKLVARFEWAKDQNPEAKILHDLYRDGFQFAFSIGFIAREVEGNTFTKSEMIEFSPVLVPANAEALLLAKKKGIDSAFVLTHNGGDMKLELILAKSLEDLTFAEIKFLRENESKLSDADKTKFAEVLETKADDTDEKIAAAVKSALEAPMAEVKSALEQIGKADVAVVKDINMKKDKAGKAAETSKEAKFLHYVRGLQSGNFTKYLEVTKDAMDTSDDSTSVLLPPAEFIAEVERLEEEYGVARRFATVRRSTNGNGITYLQGADDLEIFFTDEAGAKKSTKLGYAQKLLAWRKAAGILPITDELTEDSAVDLWNDATQRFARAFARVEDQLVFTQTSGSAPINPGILNVSGTNLVTMTGGSFEDVTYDDLSKMIWGVPTPSSNNGRFYLHREILGVIQRIKDEEGRPIWQRAMADGTPATILGKPYELTEVLPDLGDDAVSTRFMVFGDLRYVTLGERTGMNIKVFDTGMVGDPDEDTQGDDLNLLTQDMQAMRAVKRFNAIVRFPAAFSVLQTGSSVS